jgi:hypothetical protein
MIIITIFIIFIDQAKLGLYRSLEECVDPSIVTVGALYFGSLTELYVKVSSVFVCRPLVERDISTVIWIVEFYYLHIVILYWKCIGFWWERQKKRGHWENLDIIGKVGG